MLGASMTSQLLPALLMGKPQALTWSTAAQTTFDYLKHHFTFAPILKRPYPTKQFIVELGASEVWIGDALSQRHGDPPKMYPCAFFSRKLTLTQRKCDHESRTAGGEAGNGGVETFA